MSAIRAPIGASSTIFLFTGCRYLGRLLSGIPRTSASVAAIVGIMIFRRPLDCAMMASMIDFGLQLDLSLRLLGAAALGLAIGLEREIHGHPAGLRTHMLVALGSGLFTVLSIHGFGG